MGMTLEPWQLTQLQRLERLDPERTERVLNTLWEAHPELFEDLAVAAVDQEMLTVEGCAELLGYESDEIEHRLLEYRGRTQTAGCRIVLDEERGNVARLAEARIPIWEIVREFRKLGSVELLREAFPFLTPSELVAAMRYAEAHPSEIEAQIQQFESLIERRKTEYPFAK